MSGLLGDLSHQELMRLRNKYSDSKAMQNALAPLEHRAYAREAVQNNPLMAASLIPAIPAYQLVKMLGLMGARSDPSLAQIIEGYKGVGQGLLGK